MNLLLKLGKETKLEKPEKYSSPLERFVVQRGSETLKRFLKADPITVKLDFGSDFDPLIASIDAEHKLNTVDRLSQVSFNLVINDSYNAITSFDCCWGKTDFLGLT